MKTIVLTLAALAFAFNVAGTANAKSTVCYWQGKFLICN